MGLLSTALARGAAGAIVLLCTSIDIELTRAARAAAGARRQPLSAGAPPANAFSAAALSEPGSSSVTNIELD